MPDNRRAQFIKKNYSILSTMKWLILRRGPSLELHREGQQASVPLVLAMLPLLQWKCYLQDEHRFALSLNINSPGLQDNKLHWICLCCQFHTSNVCTYCWAGPFHVPKVIATICRRLNFGEKSTWLWLNKRNVHKNCVETRTNQSTVSWLNCFKYTWTCV